MINLSEALEQTATCKRHLLLGNGFSISLFPKCFSYASLFQEAKEAGLFTATPELAAAFEALNTTDFEFVMESLKAASLLGPLYGFDGQKLAAHAELLKQVLVEAIAGRHPSRPSEISEEQYRSCRAFLAEFIGSQREDRFKGRIFSLNYDLLLYWSVLHDIHDASPGFLSENIDQDLKNDDGFRAPEDNFDAEYVAWDQFNASNSQSVTFLHGALHLYERGSELSKLCWERSGNTPLMDQIRGSLDQDRYPLFVSEGTSSFKMKKINRSAYLSKGLRSFAQCCNTKSASIFIIGHSLADNDAHVFKRISKGKVQKLYVSIFGDPLSQDNLAIRAKAERLSAQRPLSHPLDVNFIDAETLHIWNH